MWRTQQGPHYADIAAVFGRGAGRMIGEIVCPYPSCGNKVVGLFDHPGGIAVRAWIPAVGAPADHDGRSVGWTLFGVVDKDTPDGETATVHCWRGHHGLTFTAADCRELAAWFRERGKKKRRPAVASEPGPTDVE